MSLTVERLASVIQRELAIIVNDVIKDKEVGYINLTEVRVSKDLSYATTYYTILSDDEKVLEKAETILTKNNALIRKNLAKKIKNTRKIPELVFKYDNALAYGNRINEILNQIK